METVLSFKLCRTETYFKCVLENDIYEVYRHRKRKNIDL
jgi:hypothetical protein